MKKCKHCETPLENDEICDCEPAQIALLKEVLSELIVQSRQYYDVIGLYELRHNGGNELDTLCTRQVVLRGHSLLKTIDNAKLVLE